MSLRPREKSSIYYKIIRLYLIAVLLFGLFVVLAQAVETYNSRRDMIGTGGAIHNLGQFYTNDGNPGIIQFGAKPLQTEYSGGHLLIPETGRQSLTGSFWIETIGWVNMHDIEFYLTDTGAGIWSLSGYAWSETSGWIDFSGATYQLSNTSFSGYAWNDIIGWIDMQGASLDMTSSGAIGKVKILGTFGGNRIFNTIYTLDGKIAPATVTRIINQVRKNTSLLTRNIPNARKNTNIVSGVFDHGDNGGSPRSLDNKLFFINTGSTVARVDYTKSIQTRFVNTGSLYTPVLSAIVIGADVYIDNSILPQQDNKPRVIIALKNSAGVGGNIVIDGGVTKIRSTLLAEGSIYSGEYDIFGVQKNYNNDPSGLFRIPNRQLYIYGSTISNNTVGGYGTDNGSANVCPYNIVPCDDSTALIYDLNHFRDFQRDLPEGQLAVIRGYPTNTYDDYSIIIEHDPRILDTPPPGLETLQ